MGSNPTPSASIGAPALAQETDLDRAYQVCNQHAQRDPHHASVITGWPDDWKDCAKIVDAWEASRKAEREAEHHDLINKALQGLSK